MSDGPSAIPATARRDLFLVSLLLLFLELACIRWFPAHVLFLTFFTNTVLLACFLGMSLGCLAVGHRRNYLAWTPPLLLIGLLAGLGMEALSVWLAQVVDVGQQSSPQVVFFGTEYHAPDLATFAIPVEVIAAFFFVLITLVMVGPGQVLGRSLAALPHRVEAYTINILGSVAGIVLFALCSWFQLSPFWWLLPVSAGLLYFLRQNATPTPFVSSIALLLPLVVLVPSEGRSWFTASSSYWSPYYHIVHESQSGTISVNLIGHQQMHSRDTAHPAYPLPHLLNRDTGGEPFKEILIIGAGSGNDVSRALQWCAPDGHIDAVEIDPVIQYIGQRDHPDRPYDDPRVTVHLNDGRNFLRSTPKKYDLVLFALVDSLVLHSSYSNIRLESYLFTEQALADVHRVLKPDGLFAMYNYFRQGWIVARLKNTVRAAFGSEPVVMTFPAVSVVEPEGSADGFTFLLAGGRSEAIRAAFADPERRYWLRNQETKGETVVPVASHPGSPNGFEVTPPAEQRADFLAFWPAHITEPKEPLLLASDDWPFLYLREPMIPWLSLRGMLLLAGLSLVLLGGFAPRSLGRGVGRWAFDGRMFFLGAGFMLIETKAVVHMALLFGSTWMVNSVVFFAILIMILAANLFVLKLRPGNLVWAYLGLAVVLGLNAVVPLDAFLGQSWPVQVVGSCLLVFAPILFAGVIFAVSFSRTAEPDRAFGFNIAGAMLGGLAENASMILGFRYLVLVALGFYLLSACFPVRSEASRVESAPAVV